MMDSEGTSTSPLEARLLSLIQDDADPLGTELVAHFREMSEVRQQALLQYVVRRKQGVPQRDNLVRLYRDWGHRKREVRALADLALKADAMDPAMLDQLYAEMAR